jgi:hypothetical protein
MGWFDCSVRILLSCASCALAGKVAFRTWVVARQSDSRIRTVPSGLGCDCSRYIERKVGSAQKEAITSTAQVH